MSRRHALRCAAMTGGGVLIAMISACALITEPPEEGETFTDPLPGLGPEERQLFLRGDEAFERAFSASDGLGPRFNEASCEGCHPGDGRGPASTVVVKFNDFGDPLLGSGGPVLQNLLIPGATGEVVPTNAQTTSRLPPPVFGVGLIEAIPEHVIVANEDPDDLDGDGISGRVHWVTPPAFVPPTEVGAGPEPRVGRFGRKAGAASLVHQVADAYQQDMGITSDFIPFENDLGQGSIGDLVPDPEVPASDVLAAVAYVRFLAPPARGPETEAVRQGESLFASIGCVDCHTPTLKTGPSNAPDFDEVEVHLYSDLLLHNMGPELADNGHFDQDATPAEWKTPPLWGLRLAADPLGEPAPLMHDGRTTDLRVAIELHGGEGEASRDAWRALGEADKDAVIAFLESL